MSQPRVPLGQLLREPLRNGKSARASPSGTGVRVFSLSAVTQNDFGIENTKPSVLSEAEAEGLWAQPGDIFIQRSNTPELVGTAALYKGADRFAVFPDLLIRVRVSTSVLPDYLIAYLRSNEARAYFRAHARGIAGSMPKVGQEVISALKVPLPPLEEQYRVALAIEAHTSRLDVAVALLQRTRRQLKRARAGVLKAAVEGRLVPTEAALARAAGRDYEPAQVLLERILAERRARWAESGTKGKYKEPVVFDADAQTALPEGWTWATLDELADVVGGITKDSKKSLGREVPYLRVANVQRGRLDLSAVKTIVAPEPKIQALRLLPGDILLNEGGDRDKLGRGWVWRGELAECIHQNHVFRARPRSPTLDSRYLSHYANSQGERYFLDQGKQTTNLASISLSKIKALPIAIPPASEQLRIANELDRRFSVLDQLETAVEANLARCARLRQSILKRAFEGRLLSEGAVTLASPTATKAAV